MNINSAFPSKWLRATDLPDRKLISLTIESVQMVKMEMQNDRKPALRFSGKEKALVLNKTNALLIAQELGSPETDDWIGKKIKIFRDTTTFGGKPTPCIRVKVSEPTEEVVLEDDPPFDPDSEEPPF